MAGAIPNPRMKIIRINPTSLNSLFSTSARAQPSPSPSLQTFLVSNNFNAASVSQIVPGITVKSEIEVEREVEIETDANVDNRKRKNQNRPNESYLEMYRQSSSSSPYIHPKPKTVAQSLKAEAEGDASSFGQEKSLAAKEKRSKAQKGRNKRYQYCRICERGFKHHEGLLNHFYADHPTITKQEDMFDDPWRCMYCDNWYDGPRRLSYHVKSVHKEALSVKDAVIDNRPQLVECKLCGAVLKSSLIKHTLKAHANQIDEQGSDVVKDPRRCMICGKMCSGEQGIRHHMYRTHGTTVAKEFEKNSNEVSTDAHLPIGGKRPSTDEESAEMKRRRAPSPVGVDGYEESFQIVEETVITESSDQSQTSQATTDGFDQSTEEVTYCEVCQIDLLNTVHFLRHVELRHKPIVCPICRPIVWCKGQIGLESHDDSVHRGAIRLQAATSLT